MRHLTLLIAALFVIAGCGTEGHAVAARARQAGVEAANGGVQGRQQADCTGLGCAGGISTLTRRLHI